MAERKKEERSSSHRTQWRVWTILEQVLSEQMRGNSDHARLAYFFLFIFLVLLCSYPGSMSSAGWVHRSVFQILSNVFVFFYRWNLVSLGVGYKKIDPSNPHGLHNAFFFSFTKWGRTRNRSVSLLFFFPFGGGTNCLPFGSRF